ncbi:MAG: hypothetical protein M5U12_31725 [Verrucomicrobia bacterium]|nr:hypothetical protein [Verrucomicrobiota bacterium]
MPLPTTPGVYFETLDSDRTRVRGLRTDIAALVGIAERGPLDQPVRVSSHAQFTAAFGGYLPGAYLAYAAKAFFENGGRTGYFVRVAAPPRTTQTSALPQPADRGSSLVLDSTGFATGAVVTVTQHRQTTTTGGVQPADRLSSLVLEVAGFPRTPSSEFNRPASSSIAAFVQPTCSLTGSTGRPPCPPVSTWQPPSSSTPACSTTIAWPPSPPANSPGRSPSKPRSSSRPPRLPPSH